ncbi:hypothetical protein ACP70R_012219 [Stipagrostis hirtigluma subsp. patula]
MLGWFLRMAEALNSWITSWFVLTRQLLSKIHKLRNMDSAGEHEPKRPRPSPARLPDELIYYSILPCLPARPLLRFATVCSAWRDLILRDAVFAGLQAQSPTRASAALARFHNGRFEVLTPDGAAVAPPDPCLSFLPLAACARPGLKLRACTGGLLLMSAWATFVVVNPATREFQGILYRGSPGVAGLAYDPGRGYDLVLAVPEGRIAEAYRFWRFSSRAAGSGWRPSRDTLRLSPYDQLLPRSAYAGGRVHWLSSRGDIIWYDVVGDLHGKASPPDKCPSTGARLEGNWDLGAWCGQLRLACCSGAGVGVWALASYGGGADAGASPPARWELVHWRSWCQIPGAVGGQECFLRSEAPAGMEPGGDGGLGLALRSAHTVVVDGKTEQVWRRSLVRYDLRTGATEGVAELAGKEVHDDFGAVFGYHSSMAALPQLNWAA